MHTVRLRDGIWQASAAGRGGQPDGQANDAQSEATGGSFYFSPPHLPASGGLHPCQLTNNSPYLNRFPRRLARLCKQLRPRRTGTRSQLWRAHVSAIINQVRFVVVVTRITSGEPCFGQTRKRCLPANLSNSLVFRSDRLPPVKLPFHVP